MAGFRRRHRFAALQRRRRLLAGQQGGECARGPEERSGADARACCATAQWVTIDAAELVPGDVVSVAAGQIVPADLLLIDGEYLSCDQAALTGESLPVSKKIGDERLFRQHRQTRRDDRRRHRDGQQHLLRPDSEARRRGRRRFAFAARGDAGRRFSASAGLRSGADPGRRQVYREVDRRR